MMKEKQTEVHILYFSKYQTPHTPVAGAAEHTVVRRHSEKRQRHFHKRWTTGGCFGVCPRKIKGEGEGEGQGTSI